MTRDGAAMVLATTQSVCPVCLQRLPAERVREGDSVYLRKTCPDHGPFKAVIWRGAGSYAAWGVVEAPVSVPLEPVPSDGHGCPFDCGLCPEHQQRSCCVLIEVTHRCNLACPVCFAEAGGKAPDPSFDEIRVWLEALKAKGGQVNIQLSGGEPTLRDDLPEIVALAHAIGFEFVQVNTNGLRLAREQDYARKLKEAGLDCVFLQFDGVSNDVYRAIRGADLLETKLAAIDRCAGERLGVVLVPVLVPDVNTGQIGDIIRFAAAQTPIVRTVHFQPISYFGRYPNSPRDEDRFTIPDVLRAIEQQTFGAIKVSDFRPGTAENPYCSFNGDFVVGSDGAISAAPRSASSSCCDGGKTSSGEEAEQARRFVARRWAAPDASGEPASSSAFMKIDSLVAFLESRKRSLVVSGMVFQDAWTLDLDRLRRCYIHIATADRRLVPLCAFNLSAQGGGTFYRTASP